MCNIGWAWYGLHTVDKYKQQLRANEQLNSGYPHKLAPNTYIQAVNLL